MSEIETEVQPVPAEESQSGEVPDEAPVVVKEPPSLEVLNARVNGLYKEIKRYLQLRNDLTQLDVLADLFEGEAV